MGEARVFFCTGATKAGTSWLYEYLAAHPEVHLRAIKELHYFDALEDGRLAERAAEVARARAKLAARLEDAEPARREVLARRIADHDAYLAVLARGVEDGAAYRAYLEDGRGARAVVGDVTPAYALLPPARLGAMARLAGDVRFVYLLRDPVERLWSHVRMMAVRRGGAGEISRKRADNILARTLSGEERQIEIRSDYRGALERLKAAVAPARRLVAFYEELFAGDAAARICAFLGIAPRPAPVAERVHAGRPLRMRPEQRAAARAWLAPQYDYVATHHGPLPAAWGTDTARM